MFETYQTFAHLAPVIALISAAAVLLIFVAGIFLSQHNRRRRGREASR